jgi:hypothetical protein
LSGSRSEAGAGDREVADPLRAKVTKGPVPMGPDGGCGRTGQWASRRD